MFYHSKKNLSSFASLQTSYITPNFTEKSFKKILHYHELSLLKVCLPTTGMISPRAIWNFWSLYIRLVWLKILPITSQAISKCRTKICLTASGSKINVMSFRYMNQWIHLKLMWRLLSLLNKFSKYHLYSHSEHLHFFQQQQIWYYL